MLKKILVPTDGSPESAWAIPVAEKLAVDHGARALLVQVLQYPDPGKRLRSAQREQMLELSTELARSNLDALAARFRSSGIEVESSLLFGSPAGGLLDVEVEQHPDLDLTLSRALVMLDGSGVAEAALPMIEELTAHPITSVVLFRAITDSEDRVAATTYFLGVKERLTGSGLQIELSVEVGDPTELIRHASEGVDVIVLATHGRGGFNRFRHGSVAERIVREADKPVLLVRAAAILPR